MSENLNVRIADLVFGLSSALDLVSPSLVHHHRQVLGFAIKLAEAFRLSEQQKSDIFIAAMLHDIGVVAFNRGIDLVFDDASINDHAEFGFRLMQRFRPFRSAAGLVRYHHASLGGAGDSDPVALGSSIIHLADRVAVRLDVSRCLLSQAEDIRSWVAEESGEMFMPAVVEAFLQESRREFFWLDALYDKAPQLRGGSPFLGGNMELDMDGLMDLSELFRMIIDYRSRHTASHSRSVAYIAEALARLIGFSANACRKIHVAGNLHDLGKLALPASILDKPGPLSEQERNIVKSHAYHSHRILRDIRGLEEICDWAALHHECPDGSGYPFRLCDEEIPLGARIVAVADIFSALTESRPYRNGLSREECLRIMLASAAERKLDPLLVSLVAKHYDDLYDLQLSVRRDGMREYENILQETMPFISGAAVADLPFAVMSCG